MFTLNNIIDSELFSGEEEPFSDSGTEYSPSASSSSSCSSNNESLLSKKRKQLVTKRLFDDISKETFNTVILSATTADSRTADESLNTTGDVR